MAGLDLSYDFYKEYGKPMIDAEFSQYKDRIAVGLVGHGSECFGFDDEISVDHDFNEGFCIFITEEDEKLFGFKLFRAYNKLCKEHLGFDNEKSLMGGNSKGVKTISDFYSQYTGRSGAPETWQDWLYTPSHYFAEATNGKVFCDELGEFTDIRESILYGMPESVRRKKIASKAITMAQTGQYNFSRCLKHGDRGAASLVLSRFCESASQMVYLLNEAHAPYYKWLLRGMEKLPKLGDLNISLRKLLCDDTLSDEMKIQLIEDVSKAVINQLTEDNLCNALGDYLEPYAFAINDKIKNSEIRNLPIFQD